MKNQNKIHSMLKVLVIILSGVIIGVSVYGCKKKEPVIEFPTMVIAIVIMDSVMNHYLLTFSQLSIIFVCSLHNRTICHPSPLRLI